jgi:hypothetical protein
LGAWAGDCAETPDSIYQKATSILAGTDMKVTATIPSQSLSAEGPKQLTDRGRNIVIVLLILGVVFIVLALIDALFLFFTGLFFIIAIIYYFVALEKTSFNVGITQLPQGSRVSITSRGDKAEGLQNQLIGIIVPAGRGAYGVSRCKSCGAVIADASMKFCPSCGSKV